MTKKLLYLLISISFALLNISSSFADTVSYARYYDCPGTAGATWCCSRYETYNDVSLTTCTMDNITFGTSHIHCYIPCGTGTCTVPERDALFLCSENPPGLGMCTAFQNSVGGCNSTPKYCSTSPVYQKVSAFLGVISVGGASPDSWSYATVIGSDGVDYKCAVGATSGNNIKIIGTYDSLKKIDPQTSKNCLSPSAYSAVINTNCSLSTGWARNTGYYTNTQTGTITHDPTQVETTPISPDSTVTNPQGAPIDPSGAGTGYDSNKDGFDDYTGQPLPLSSGSGSGLGDSDGDGTVEVEIKDPDPDEIPAVPVAPEDDTSIESPDEEDIATLFDILNTAPFVSVITGVHIGLSGMLCSLSTEVYGSEIKFDFCDSRVAGILSSIGSFLVVLASVIGVISIFD